MRLLTTMPPATPGYLYIIHEREFVNAREPVYKFGRTTNIAKRIAQYPKGSRVMYTEWFEGDHVKAETELLRDFGEVFKNRDDVGREYFECDVRDMRRVVRKYVDDYAGQYGGGGERGEEEPANKPHQAIDPSVVVMDFIDEHRRMYSGKMLQTKLVYAEYVAWAERAGGLKPASYTRFLGMLRDMYNVRVKTMNFADTGTEQAAVFPNLMPRPTCPTGPLESVIFKFAFNK